MTPPDPIRVERADGVLSLTLARPEKRNALDAASVERLLELVSEAADDGTRLLVLRGEGKSFSAGFDFSAAESESDGDLLLRFVRIETLLQAVHHAPFETMAVAQGLNFGAGVDLFCACSRRFAAPGASFRMPGLQFGIVLGTRRFADIAGESRARAILAAGETFDAERALAIGVAEAVLDPAEWRARASEIVEAGRALDPTALAALRARTRIDRREEDLYHLVMSASAPGLKDRIRIYLGPRSRA